MDNLTPQGRHDAVKKVTSTMAVIISMTAITIIFMTLVTFSGETVGDYLVLPPIVITCLFMTLVVKSMLDIQRKPDQVEAPISLCANVMKQGLLYAMLITLVCAIFISTLGSMLHAEPSDEMLTMHAHSAGLGFIVMALCGLGLTLLIPHLDPPQADEQG